MHLLGAVLAILSAATFALTNATGRRGVISGTPAQGMVISMPVGLACFLAFALLTGALQHLGRFSGTALASLSAAGCSAFRSRAILQLPREPGGRREPDRARGPAQLRGHARFGRRHSPRALHDAAGRRRRPDGLGVACYPALLAARRRRQAGRAGVQAARCGGLLLCPDRGARLRHIAHHRAPGAPRHRGPERIGRRRGRLRGSDRRRHASASSSHLCAAT